MQLFMQSWWTRTSVDTLLQEQRWIPLKHSSYSNEQGQCGILLWKDIPFVLGVICQTPAEAPWYTMGSVLKLAWRQTRREVAIHRRERRRKALTSLWKTYFTRENKVRISLFPNYVIFEPNSGLKRGCGMSVSMKGEYTVHTRKEHPVRETWST